MRRSRLGEGSRASGLAAIGLSLVVGCTTAPVEPTATPTPQPTPAGQECEEFAPHPSDSFYSPLDSTTDATVLEVPTGTLTDAGLVDATVTRAADNIALLPPAQSLLIMRGGRLVFERYYDDSSAAEANNIASVSKSMLSLLTGIAIDEGHLTLESRVDEFLPADVVGDNGGLTVRHLLTMTAGLRLDDVNGEYWYDDTPSNEPGEPSFVRAVLAREQVAVPDTEFTYSTGLTQVLASVLTEATGQSLCLYAADRLLGPLGIDVDMWWVAPDGYFAGGHSMAMTPRELAVLGQLVLQGGEWQGRQLVPRDWIEASTSERWDLGCNFLRSVHQGYGYLWWLYDFDGHRAWNMSGFGGQEVLVFPDLDIVQVITQDPVGTGEASRAEVLAGTVARAAFLDGMPADHEPPCPATDLNVFTMRPDGSGRSRQTGWPAGLLPMSYSSVTDRLVGWSDRLDLNTEIYSVAADGSDLRRLTMDTTFDSLPALSPDGTQVAWTRGPPSSSEIWIADADGSNARRVTQFSGFAQAPCWSPDGGRICYVGGASADSWGATGLLQVIGADGGSGGPLEAVASIGYPQWSPDGTRIAFELRASDLLGGQIGVLDIRAMTIDVLGPGFVPKWSPDSTQLVFIRNRPLDKHGGSDVFIIDLETRAETQLTDDAAFDTFPLWLDDGPGVILYSSTAED